MKGYGLPDRLEGKKRKVQQLHVGQLVMLEVACVGGLLLSLTLAAAGLGVFAIFLDGVSTLGPREKSPSTIPGTVLTELELTQRLRATNRLNERTTLDSLELIRLSAIHTYDLIPEDREKRARLLAERSLEIREVVEISLLIATPPSQLIPEEQERQMEVLREIGAVDQLTLEEQEDRALEEEKPSGGLGPRWRWISGFHRAGAVLIGLIGVGITGYAGIGSLCTWFEGEGRSRQGKTRRRQPGSATYPTASMAGTAAASSLSDVSPVTPTAPMMAPLPSLTRTPPGTGTSLPSKAPLAARTK